MGNQGGGRTLPLQFSNLKFRRAGILCPCQSRGSPDPIQGLHLPPAIPESWGAPRRRRPSGGYYLSILGERVRGWQVLLSQSRARDTDSSTKHKNEMTPISQPDRSALPIPSHSPVHEPPTLGENFPMSPRPRKSISSLCSSSLVQPPGPLPPASSHAIGQSCFRLHPLNLAWEQIV